uniref:ACB domain-containing protein n=1 Tax=Parastrongyloides trichosuri TaxID=131310 RepID=A0A0N4ZKN6_PARTI
MNKEEAMKLFVDQWEQLNKNLPNYLEYFKLLVNPQITEKELETFRLTHSISEDNKIIDEELDFDEIEWIVEDDTDSSSDDE